jgi:L-ascorbate metabolism protein UlaG (beta-lactamase superfamily)
VLLAATPVAPPRVEITYLGNEGVLVAFGGQRVAIDALHREFPRAPYYEHLPAPYLEKLEAAEAPFDRIRVHLTTHVHADHFHGESVARHLEKNGGMDAVVPREAPEELCRGRAPGCGTSPRLHVLKSGWGAEKELVFGDIRVTVLDLPHAKGARTMVDNLGYLVTLGRTRILHVGDAHMSPETFARFRLPERKIDYAFVPYWYLLSEEGRRLVKEHIGAKRLVAFHIPPGEHASAAERIHKHLPDALVLTRMMRTERLAAP